MKSISSYDNIVNIAAFNIVLYRYIDLLLQHYFSSLKRIKTWLRTTMTERRLVDLATISIERDLSYEVSLDEVVTDFAGVAARRIILS